jgi:hypothetical protein
VIGVVSYHVDLEGQQDLVNQTMGQQFQHYMADVDLAV